VVDQYTTTEAGCIAAECREGAGLHVQEDLVIVEVVDERNRAVRAGETGAKILLTVLFNRATPLIRYELADRVLPARDACPCGRPFRLLERVEGRRRELLTLANAAGEPVAVHPIALLEVLDGLPVRGWSIAFAKGVLTVRLVPDERAVDDAELIRALEESLRRRGVIPPPIRVERGSEVGLTAGRKRTADVAISAGIDAVDVVGVEAR